MPPLLLTQAKTLDQAYQTLSPEPLEDLDQLNAFYRNDLNPLRGRDIVEELAIGLDWTSQGAYFKALVYGHSGVGKSTELSRLIYKVRDRYQAIRFSVIRELDTGAFEPFDVLLFMMTQIVEETQKPLAKGGAGQDLPESLLQLILNWFAEETTTRVNQVETALSAEAGAGPPQSSILAKISGLFASIKGEIKYASDRRREIVEYRLSRISSLVALLNRLLVTCNDLLRQQTGREWLFIGEDFDRSGIPFKLTDALFLNYANIFQDLNTHLIFTVPVGLVYSARRTRLPFSGDRHLCLPDTPVLHKDHTPHREGQAALASILERRVNPNLFDPGQMERLIVASGGNLRDLFSLIRDAALQSHFQKAETIGADTVKKSIANLARNTETGSDRVPSTTIQSPTTGRRSALSPSTTANPRPKCPTPSCTPC